MDGIMAKSKVIEAAGKTSKKKLEELTAQFAQMRNTLYTQSEAEEFFSDLQAISVETECPIYSLTFVADEPPAEVKQAEQSLGVTAKKAVLSVAGVYAECDEAAGKIADSQPKSLDRWAEYGNN